LEVRLQKFLADAGVASRRASEQFILEGRVTVNGETVRQLGTKVDPRSTQVCVDGKAVRIQRKLYIALHKPRGYVCTRKDEHDRPTVGALLPREWQGLYPVGRLDYNSEGLLFLTNDGEFSLHLTHPRYGVRKQYCVTVVGRVSATHLAELTRGVFSEGERLKAESAKVISSGPSKCEVELELTEGKNREVRRMFETLGLIVKRLVRTQIGKVKLGQLKSGRWRALTEMEIKSLLAKV
jgi:23S rRNA pseudouridine2605 synthase